MRWMRYAPGQDSWRSIEMPSPLCLTTSGNPWTMVVSSYKLDDGGGWLLQASSLAPSFKLSPMASKMEFFGSRTASRGLRVIM
ncbi:hypothetical protein E3N88_37688 [Mikania micrantha]|uniref:Uncharacterized protein n=1 Tax=Mikania micrantha TaxID=192012 RepID=A0A5N6LRX9_9ASTR|nr:hypothetical protein E3N88_37688 [Mikania micrantha]